MKRALESASVSRNKEIKGLFIAPYRRTANVHCTCSSAGDSIHLKILVPSVVAGAIIGKGGETIAQIQKEAGARVKMSKANDFYPGEQFVSELPLY